MTTESPLAGDRAPQASAVPAREQQDDDAQEPVTLVPVTLQFSHIASNSNLSFTFTTAGAAWSLGAKSGDSIGFSYNVTPVSASGQSCIQAIEFNNEVLTIRTGATAQSSSGQADNAFTLTLFLQVREGVDYLQGYCTLNTEAVVLVTFGALVPVHWRNGRISAVLFAPRSNYRPISFTVQGARPGNRIEVVVSAKKGLGKVSWSMGPDFSESNGIELVGQQGLVPLTSMSVTDTVLTFVTTPSDDANASSNSGATLQFSMNAYITWAPDDLTYVYLRANCNSDVSVLAQVSNRQPQTVSQADTVFTL
ncbi:hypothetical protein GWC77_16320 [Paraburkholderia sp. NMBU_R16]|uniref:hypothetical protein n=1 Tax=Paraburkholderia sp. NMBU_R16 TaxID=2698676 RepID=UPI001565C8BD|nr:hypothetical protein [Paraburkholderia sp. NMBU_R16]NRO97489.1 hypothetical protein [Paraburkholderia sp. NMBU_R16]